MKKIIFLATTAIISFSAPSMANDHEGKGRDGGMFFEKKDENNDGFISKEEFMNMKKGGHYGKAYMMKEVDKNKDGEISKAEFLEAKEEKFKKMDANGNGKLTEEEIKSYHENKKEDRAEKKEDRMENREGKFEDIDTNKDGKISKDEMTEYHKSHKGHMKGKKDSTPPSGDE
ncbi:MAG: EF-hand domain-containing protein [Rickettsiales bacterium]|nr:EF-hand domain-containing protein [Pseudomonadota bacterium]MDA0965513.1 EF-hand domain-containing protein [Pseudomonadota bacterium]MDG4542837.1 EF-hand domain-containing protein [Rickettsiales bacterium]MDG4544715.1 EF-hand domain-containing protein [Rickettsiales bacterium]MDG4546837.1 EF-hand domain-containing protein [Rickettsiales bacterium]